MTAPATTTPLATNTLVHAAVHPWLQMLQELMPVELPFHERNDVDRGNGDNERLLPQNKIVWLASSRLPLTVSSWTRIFDALHVLALLQRVRYDLWQQTVALIWPDHAAQWSLLLSMELGIEFHPMEASDCTAVCSQLRQAVDPELLTSAKNVIRTWTILLAALGGEASSKQAFATACQRVPLRVRVAPQAPAAFHMTYEDALLRAIVTLVELQGKPHTHDHPTVPDRSYVCSSLHILAVHLDAETLTLSERGILSLYRLRSLHVRVSILSTMSFSTSGESVDQIALTIQRLCRVPLVETTANQQQHQQRHLPSGLVAMQISTDMAPHVVDALMSAVQYSQSLRTLRVQFGTKLTSDRTRNLQWIAYALLSRHALRHNITTLEMGVATLRASDVDVMGELLVATDPFAELMGVSAEQVTPHKVLLLDPTKATAGDTRLLHTKYWLSWSHLLPLRVLERQYHGGSNWTSVLLPGWGQAWLPRCGNSQLAPFTEPTFPGHAHRLVKPIPNVALTDMVFSSKSAVLALLALIGAGIHTLSIRAKTFVRMDSAWCTELLDACPSLEHLHLEWSDGHKSPVAMQPFIDGYVAGRCHMQTLSASSVTPEDASRVIVTLSDPLHPLSQQLCTFVCGVQFTNGLQCKSFLEATLRMLRVNRQLNHLKIVVAHDGVRDEDYASLRQSFLAYLQAKLHSVTAPMVIMRCKAAFLSSLPCVWKEDTKNRSECRLAVRKIFAFAAQPSTVRRVEIARGPTDHSPVVATVRGTRAP